MQVNTNPENKTVTLFRMFLTGTFLIFAILILGVWAAVDFIIKLFNRN